MLSLKYYASGKANDSICRLLSEVKTRHGITFETIDLSTNGVYDPVKEKSVYERDFKPRARILRRRTTGPISRLRSRRAGNYFISKPETIAIFSAEGIEWYSLDYKEIADFLADVSRRGGAAMEERCK